MAGIAALPHASVVSVPMDQLCYEVSREDDHREDHEVGHLLVENHCTFCLKNQRWLN